MNGPGASGGTANSLSISGSTATATLVLNGGILTVGPGGVTLLSNGNLTLAGDNLLSTPSLVVNGGSFDIGSHNDTLGVVSLQSGSILGTTGILTSTSNFDLQSGTVSANLSGAVGLDKSTTGTVSLSGVNTYTGLTTISAGTLALTGAGSIALSSGVVDNGIFDVSGTPGVAITSLSGNGSVALGGQFLSLTNASGTFSGTINGNGAQAPSLIIGGGTETLTGNNGYTGDTWVSYGATLALAGSGSIAAASDLWVNGTFDISGTTAGASVKTLWGGGTVNLGAQTLTLTNATEVGTAYNIFSGNITGTGGLTIAGGTEYLTGTNTYTGLTTINSGATLALTSVSAYSNISFQSTGSIALSSGVVDNGTFDISATAAGASVQTLSGTGTVALGAQTLTLTNAAGTFAGAIGGSGGLTLAGGTETLAGANTYTGLTAINGGTLALSGQGSIALSSGVVDNGTFDISATAAGASVQTLSGTGTVALGAQTLTLTNAAGTFAGAIGGSGGLTLAGGAETLSGANTYTGLTAINGGTLALSGQGSIASSAGVVDNGTFDIAATAAGASSKPCPAPARWPWVRRPSR